MDFENLIKKYHSIRKFIPKDVEDDKLNKIIKAAGLSQSASNRQPWKFMILKSDLKNKIAETMTYLFDNDKNLPNYLSSSKSSAKSIKSAPVLILAFQEEDSDWLVDDLLSIGAAIEHICLESVNLGLGSLWIRDITYIEKDICKIVGYDSLKLISAVAVGYAEKYPEKEREVNIDDILIESKL